MTTNIIIEEMDRQHDKDEELGSILNKRDELGGFEVPNQGRTSLNASIHRGEEEL